MCRTGGRRCPSYSDPQLIADRNARRREKYATRKNAAPLGTQPDYLSYFQPFNEIRPDKAFHSENGAELVQQAQDFAHIVMPDYDFKTGRLNSPMTRLKKWDGTADEQQALMEYTVAGFALAHDITNGVNLENNAPDSEPNFSEDYEKKIERFKKVMVNLDSALSKAVPPEEPRVLYRGLRIPTWVEDTNVWLQDKFPVGGVVSQKNYMSTTSSASEAITRFTGSKSDEVSGVNKKNIIFEIVSKQGAPLGEATSAYGTDESEVLIPRETRFKVVSVDTDVNLEAEYSTQAFSRVTKQPNVKVVRTVVRLIDVSEGE